MCDPATAAEVVEVEVFALAVEALQFQAEELAESKVGKPAVGITAEPPAVAAVRIQWV